MRDNELLDAAWTEEAQISSNSALDPNMRENPLLDQFWGVGGKSVTEYRDKPKAKVKGKRSKSKKAVDINMLNLMIADRHLWQFLEELSNSL